MNRIELLKGICEKNPGDPFSHYALAVEYRNGELYEKALQKFQEVHRNFPEYVPVYYHLGAELERADRLEEAAEIYRSGIAQAEQAGDDHARSELLRSLDLLSLD